jgi:hypothetical protein
VSVQNTNPQISGYFHSVGGQALIFGLIALILIVLAASYF